VSSPKAPDPVKTANAQAGMNVDTAQAQQLTNMVDQVGPDGSLTYTQSGTDSYVNSQGKTVNIPHYVATTALSPQQKQIKAQTDAASLNLGELANKQSGFLKNYLSGSFDVDAAAEKKLYDLGAARLDPRFAQDEETLRSRLIASGIRPGTAQFDQQMQQFGQTKNDAYNQLALNGRQQALSEALAQRNQPINEISALLSGSQVQQPQFVNTPQTGVAGTDYIGAVNNKYNADVASSNAAMGGLFGLLSAPFGMFNIKSDRRAKKDIRLIGKLLANGLGWYEFRYLTDPPGAPLRQGVMADEVRAIKPGAVTIDAADGLDTVDYEIALEAA